MQKGDRQTSTRPFPEAVSELVRQSDWVTRTGNANWAAFAEELEGLHYESLRRAVAGERRVTTRIMEECARILGIAPTYFVEYRLAEYRRRLDPTSVGTASAGINLSRLEEAVPLETLDDCGVRSSED